MTVPKTNFCFICKDSINNGQYLKLQLYGEQGIGLVFDYLHFHLNCFVDAAGEEYGKVFKQKQTEEEKLTQWSKTKSDEFFEALDRQFGKSHTLGGSKIQYGVQTVVTPGPYGLLHDSYMVAYAPPENDKENKDEEEK